MDAFQRRGTHSLGAALNILGPCPRQTTDGAGFDGACNGLNGLEIALAGNWEARLDDIDAHIFEQFRKLDLLVMGHGRAGGLLAIAHGGVKNTNRLGHDIVSPDLLNF